MTFTDFKELLSLLQTFIVPILGYGLYRLNKIDDVLLDLRDHFAKLNGRVGVCEGLGSAHQESDKERHNNFEDRLHDLEINLISGRLK